MPFPSNLILFAALVMFNEVDVAIGIMMPLSNSVILCMHHSMTLICAHEWLCVSEILLSHIFRRTEC